MNEVKPKTKHPPRFAHRQLEASSVAGLKGLTPSCRGPHSQQKRGPKRTPNSSQIGPTRGQNGSEIAPWRVFEASWPPGSLLEISWSPLGSLLDPLGAPWRRLGLSWSHLGGVLEVSWAHPGASWGRLGAFVERPGATCNIMGHLGGVSGHFVYPQNRNKSRYSILALIFISIFFGFCIRESIHDLEQIKEFHYKDIVFSFYAHTA